MRAVSALHWLVSWTKSTILSFSVKVVFLAVKRSPTLAFWSTGGGTSPRNRTYDHSRAVAGHVQALGPGGCVDAERHQQRGQTEHAQDEPAGPADPQSRVCNRERTEKTLSRVLNHQRDRMNQRFKRKSDLINRLKKYDQSSEPQHDELKHHVRTSLHGFLNSIRS